jgi:hypothetical protein
MRQPMALANDFASSQAALDVLLKETPESPWTAKGKKLQAEMHKDR